jgi:hypothetical protein
MHEFTNLGINMKIVCIIKQDCKKLNQVQENNVLDLTGAWNPYNSTDLLC